MIPYFDNTLSIKLIANSPEAQRLINNIPSGNQTQQYSTGQTVSTSGINHAKIIDVYTQNGYVYYVLEYKVKRKTYTKNARQQDISLLTNS